MKKINPWRHDGDPTDRSGVDMRTDGRDPMAEPDGTTYDADADCRVRFTQEESERCLLVAEWHAGLRKANGLPPEPDALRALLAVGCEAHLAWCRAYTLMVEAEREAAEHADVDVIALPPPRLN